MVTAAYGLGENVVQGAVNPDEFLVYKPPSTATPPDHAPHLGSKALRMVYGNAPVTGDATRNVEVPPQTAALCHQRRRGAAAGPLRRQHRKHYGRPMDIEWAKDGDSGELFIVQARPETVHSNLDASEQLTYGSGKR
jgi:pyruvate,water dikinase